MTTRRDLMITGIPALIAGGTLAPMALAQPQGGAQPGMEKVNRVLSGAWDGQQYTLPPLPYDYNALEPHIDEQTMRLHHGKHHQGYVNGLNKAVSTLKEMAGQEETDSSRLYGVQRDLSFNYGGHMLHCLFWATMGPSEGSGESGQPVGQLAEAINQSYGSFDGFKRLFKSSASGVKGSGWGILMFDLTSSRVLIKAINEHDTHFAPGAIPLLPVDVWEHAYYLKYQNDRGAYIDAWFEAVDWQAAEALYQHAGSMLQRVHER